LPVGKDAPYWTDDYEAFIAWRQERLWKDIQAVTGLTSATDLEASEDRAAA
jgi:hypothetical protein